MSGAMQLLEFTASRCVVYNPPPMLGFYFGAASIVINLGLLIASRMSERVRKSTDQGWLGWAITVFLIPAWLSGHTDKITLDQQAQTVTVQSRNFFVFWHNRQVPLSMLTDASVTGHQNQLQLNFSDGNFIYVGPDSFLGGRALAAKAINAWLQSNRTGVPLPSPQDAAYPRDQRPGESP